MLCITVPLSGESTGENGKQWIASQRVSNAESISTSLYHHAIKVTIIAANGGKNTVPLW